MKRKTKQDILYEKLEEIHKDVKEVRQNDIPKLKVDVAIVKEKAGLHAKIVSGVGGLIAVGVSTVIALVK